MMSGRAAGRGCGLWGKLVIALRSLQKRVWLWSVTGFWKCESLVACRAMTDMQSTAPLRGTPHISIRTVCAGLGKSSGCEALKRAQ